MSTPIVRPGADTTQPAPSPLDPIRWRWALTAPTSGIEHASIISVGMVLAMHANPNGSNVHPGHVGLATRARLSEASAKRAVVWLRDRGWIVRTAVGNRRRGLADTYRLALPPDQRSLVTVDTPDQRSWEPRSTVTSDRPPVRSTSNEVRAPARDDADDFETFWAAYPRKVNKPRARGAWNRARRSGVEAHVIVGGAKRYADLRATEIARGDDPKFTVHPHTWLTDQRWTDEPPPRRTNRGIDS
jgi:hypothetical protein